VSVAFFSPGPCGSEKFEKHSESNQFLRPVWVFRLRSRRDELPYGRVTELVAHREKQKFGGK
jgi:hypothetical protein